MSLFGDLKQRGLWNGYQRHIVGMEPILRRMSERGVPVDPVVYEEVNQILITDRANHFKRMQELVPLEVKRKKVYKKVPKNKDGCIVEDGVWMRVLPWKPSVQGLTAYMKWRKHPIPQNFKTKKDTTNALELKRLYKKTKDELYATVIAYRKAGTILDNFMENWRPQPSGRVHSTFYFDPATGQLSSRRPNVQNAPKHDDPEHGGYARVFRRIIKAAPNKAIIEFDFKSFHAQTLAFEAQDRDYLRLAKLDIHSFLAAHLVKEPKAKYIIEASDQELKEYLAWIKKTHKFIRDKKAKPAILGYGFGLQAAHLYDMNKESFDSKREAQSVLTMLDGIFPVAKAWRDTVRMKAHQQGFLVSRHGYIRYFWEVYRWQGGEWKHGEDSEAAIAFLPANDAFGEIKDRMLVIAAAGLDEKYGLVNTVHDSLVFECPLALVDEARFEIKRIMETASTVLVDPVVAPNGLSVEVDVQQGPNWGDMS